MNLIAVQLNKKHGENYKKPLTKEKNGITIGTTFQKSKDMEEKSNWRNTFQRVSIG